MIETKITATGALTAGVLSALGAAICCAGLLLVRLGLDANWIARLRALEPLRPFWLAVTALFFGLAFWQLYRGLQSEPDADPAVKRRQRVIFWTLTALALALVALPWYRLLLF